MIDTRPADDFFSIRRRRECDKCHYRFSTMEEIEFLDLIVVKRDGRRESYDREKTEGGIKRALTKLPYTQDGFRNLIHNIELSIRKNHGKEITSEALGKIIMEHLQKFNQVAYIRFASVYREFKDTDTFREELKKLKKN